MATGGGLASLAAAKKKLTQDYGTQQQETDDALKRRFAAMGGLSGGAYIKSQEQAREQGNKAYQGANEALTAQEADINEQRAQEQLGRDFTTSERQAGQTFASSEAEKQRKLQTDQFEKQFGLSEKQYGSSEEQRKADNQYRQQEFSENQKVNKLNFLLNAGQVDSFMDDYSDQGGQQSTGLNRGQWIEEKYNKWMTGTTAGGPQSNVPNYSFFGPQFNSILQQQWLKNNR